MLSLLNSGFFLPAVSSSFLYTTRGRNSRDYGPHYLSVFLVMSPYMPSQQKYAVTLFLPLAVFCHSSVRRFFFRDVGRRRRYDLFLVSGLTIPAQHEFLPNLTDSRHLPSSQPLRVLPVEGASLISFSLDPPLNASARFVYFA